MIIARTPFRVSLFGGGTDYPAWYREHGGAVVGFAIDRYCTISLRRLPPFFDYKHRIVYSRIELAHRLSDIQHPAVRAALTEHPPGCGIELHHDGDLPARSGLGSSSAFMVGLLQALAALDGRLVDRRILAAEATRLEQDVLGETVGAQDQVWAAYGGFNHVTFRRDAQIDVVPVIIPPLRRRELEASLMLVFTGFSRYASTIASRQVAQFATKQRNLGEMLGFVADALSVLESERPLREIGTLLHESWQWKRDLDASVSSPEIDGIYAAGREAGALGGKLIGAGGGGFILFYVPIDKRADVEERLKRYIRVRFTIGAEGSRIVLYEPEEA